MRAYKIILMIVLAFILLIMIVGTIDIYTIEISNLENILILIFSSVGILVGFLAMWYHVISFRYYRKSKQNIKSKKIPLILWIGAIASGVYYTFLGILSGIGTIAEIAANGNSITTINMMMLIALLLIILHGIFSLLETSILSRHMKRLREEFSVRNEIDEIGN